MKFWTIFRFEFAYQVRRPWLRLFVAVLIVLCFLMTRDGSLSEVLYSEFYLNSSFAVAKTTVFGSLIWLVMAAAIAGDAVTRDVETRMHPLVYTAPIGKASYLGGKFLAALVLNALVLLSVQAGVLLGVYLPGVDASLIGPFRPAAFLTAYAFISLPNAFAATAVQFLVATRSGRAMGAYFGSFLLVFMGFFVASLLLFKQSLGTLLDPIGIRFVVEDMAHMWTTVEKNTRQLELEGTMLLNRLVWLSVGLMSLMIAFLSFHFAYRREGTWWWRRTMRREAVPMSKTVGTTPSARTSVPQIARTFRVTTHTCQMLAVAWTSFKTIATTWGGLAMLVIFPLLAVPVVLDQMESRGFPLVPTTIRVIGELTGSLSDELSRWVIIPFLIVFFAGELVWREREARLGEITDAMPGSDWAPFLGKSLGLALVLILFLGLQIGGGMLAQEILGYHNHEVGLYLKIMFGIQLTDYLLFALLALVIHVVIDQKYVGHLVAIVAFVFIAMASLFGIEHNLLVYGASPGWSYTEMRGFGPSLAPWLWFKGYWVAWALLLAVVARLLWMRGKESHPLVRFQLARRRFRGATVWIASMATGLLLVLGVFIFYNTNVLNHYLSASEKKERQAEYERRYGMYAGSPQPRLTDTKLHLEIYPEDRKVDIRGTYRLVNESDVTVDTLILSTASSVETKVISFDRPVNLVLADEKFGHSLYLVKTPLQPGDSLQISFQVHVKPHGFKDSGVDLSVVENGTYFTNAWLPTIGYQESRQLINASDRRDYGLTPHPLIASLYDAKARKSKGGGITFEAVVGTQKGQVAVAPGALRRSWTKGGRRYFHYATDGPIGSEWGFFSANYAIHEARWTHPEGAGKEVDIRIFHQPGHTSHLKRMVQSISASLDYYSRHFGPYEYSHLSFVEGPGNGTGMHAEASMISYSEGFSQWQPEVDPGSPDIPFAVVAHEMAHQWTVPYANVEGAPVMSESLAWYYAMKVVERANGAKHFRKFLNWMHEPYRREIRRGEPLLRGLDPYMSYRRGPFALYAMSEYVGENQVNRALRILLDKHSVKGASLATTLDLYRELKAVTPDSLQYLLHDLFEVNTNWELVTEQATAKPTSEGTWQVTLEVQARKMVYDEAGVGKEVPMDDWIEVGVFPPDNAGKSDKPLYLMKHRIRSGKQKITLKVPDKPAHAGIDPNNLLIDSKTEDNIKYIEP